MQPDNYTLEGVVIKGERPLVTMKNGILTANVANTELSYLGDARDVLSRLPLLTQLQRQNLFSIKFQSVFAPLSFQLVDYQ